ncbi:MAG: hypothetical protein Q4D35_02140 [Ruminococcus sp.]|nr:hypothetical protein [Ruminococcus sp.]
MSGNFHGVCPILNRATVIPNTVCAYASCEGQRSLLLHEYVNAFVFAIAGPKYHLVLSDFFIAWHGTHGRV